MVIINMINGSIERRRCFNSTIIIASSPSYSRATTFDFQHDESPRRWRQCYLIPPSLMQHIIINNIKQAPPLDERRQEIIYYKWRAREWVRNDGRNYINTMNINI